MSSGSFGPLTVRRYGDTGTSVVVVHGGPGAPGHAASLARELGEDHRVLEPLQRLSSPAPSPPLSVARHVADLREVLATEFAGEEKPVLLGTSWGAMLILAFAAEHADLARALVLVGCGTFDVEARDEFRARLDARLTDQARALLATLERGEGDPDDRLRAMAALVLPAYSHDRLPHADETVAYDANGNREAWTDMIRLQEDGTYPAAFARIELPVLMLHGTDDPHPGDRIHASLAPLLKRLDYVSLERCGHEPWLERHAREPFFANLRGWIAANAG